MNKRKNKQKQKALYFDNKLNLLIHTDYIYKQIDRFIIRELNITDKDGKTRASSKPKEGIALLSDTFIAGYVKKYNQGRFITSCDIIKYQDETVIKFSAVNERSFSIQEVELLMRKAFKIAKYTSIPENTFITATLLDKNVIQNDYTTFSFQ